MADPIKIEVAALFSAMLYFVCPNTKETKRMMFDLPPGVHPNPEWLPKLIKETQREAIKALKLDTKDLSWRLPTPNEFVQLTTGNTALNVEKKWAEPYEGGVILEEETSDSGSN